MMQSFLKTMPKQALRMNPITSVGAVRMFYYPDQHHVHLN